MSIIADKKNKVLIAGENIGFRNSLATRLRLQNIVVEFASGGFHLLNLVETNKELSMIIIHEDLVDMSAKEIILLIRISKSKSDLPILFISKNNKMEEIRDIVQTGANDYIVNTINLQPIVERAQKYLSSAK